MIEREKRERAIVLEASQHAEAELRHAEDGAPQQVERDADDDGGQDRARRGAWYEYIGDFRCIGEIGDPDTAYEHAIAVYEEAGDPDTECSEQEHWYTMAVYREVARAADTDPGPIDSMDDDRTLSDWVERKRTTYPSLLAELSTDDEF